MNYNDPDNPRLDPDWNPAAAMDKRQERDEALQDDARDEVAPNYGGSLLEDCAAVTALGSYLGMLRMMPQPEGLFEKAWRLNKEQSDSTTKGDSQ